MTLHAENKALEDFGRGRYSNPFASGTPETAAYDREWRGVARLAASDAGGEKANEVNAALDADDFAGALRILGSAT